jgi:hypothetical protein
MRNLLVVRLSSRSAAKLLVSYWGYLALVMAVAGFFMHALGVMVVLALGLGSLGYFLFQAPVTCCAEIRSGEWCRNNSHGLLRGCHIRQHKWQRLKKTFTPAGARSIFQTSKTIGGALGTFSGAVAGVQILVAAGVLVFH